MGQKGEGSGGKGGGNWEWGTPCPPPLSSNKPNSMNFRTEIGLNVIF